MKDFNTRYSFITNESSKSFYYPFQFKEFKEKYHFSNQFLHAYKIGFGDLKEPLTSLSRKEFTAEPREEIANILTKLENINEE